MKTRLPKLLRAALIAALAASPAYGDFSSLPADVTTDVIADGWGSDLSTFTVYNGATATVNGGYLRVSTTPPSPYTSTIGTTSNGTMTIQGAANAIFSNILSVGESAGSVGTINVTGAQSTLTVYDKYTTTGGDSYDYYTYIGKSGTGTLNVSNGGTASFKNYLYIGFNAGSTGTVKVAGSSSSLTSTSTAYVGYTGTGTLTVTDGATTDLKYAVVGHSAGSNGTFEVTNGGKATIHSTNLGGVLSIGSTSGANGTARVDGSGSTLTADFARVGYLGSGSLQVSNGGDATFSGMEIGRDSGSSGTVEVSGSGSKLTSGSTTYSNSVGYYGNGKLKVSDGATATLTGDSLYIGQYANSSGAVEVTGNGAKLTTASTTTTYVGYEGSGALTVSNGGTAQLYGTNFCVGTSSGSSGTVTVSGGGTAQFNASNFFVGNSSGSTGTVTVTGADSSMTSKDTYVGYFGNGTLTVSDGGGASMSNLAIGVGASSTGKVEVSGAGAQLTTGDDTITYVGYSGNGTLKVSNGGTANLEGNKLYVGHTSGSNGTIEVSGGTLTTASDAVVYIGNSGTGALAISEGGTATLNGSNFYVGYASGSKGTVTVDGDGSCLTANHTYIGSSGNGSLAVSNGATAKVNGQDFIVGYNSGVTGTVDVSGSGSQLTTANNTVTYVGSYGTGKMNVSNGASAQLGTMAIGAYAGANGTVEVSGTNSKLSTTASSTVYVGNKGTGTLNVSSGGKAELNGSNLYVGNIANASGAITVTGENSELLSAGDTYIGKAGTGTMSVSNGGAAEITGDTYIGDSGSGTLSISNGGSTEISGDNLYVGNAASSSGTVEVNGGQLTTAYDTNVYIGYRGTGTLNVASGGTVELNGPKLYVGETSGTVTVSDANSKLVSNGDTYIGDAGTGSLSISNGGAAEITGDSFSVGNCTGASGTVSVSGNNSGLVANANTWVGNAGTGTLTISGGASAKVTGDYLYVGALAGSDGTVSVTGATSSLSAGDTYVAQEGTGKLSIDGGASAKLSYLSIGTTNTSHGSVTVDGADSLLEVANNLYVGGAPVASSRTVTVSVVNIFAQNTSENETSINSYASGYDPAELTITSGATTLVNGNYLYIGYTSDLEGIVKVTGAGSTLTASNAAVYVGHDGTGSLTINEGGTASLGSLVIGNNTDSSGTVTVSGTNSKLSTTSGTSYIGNSGTGKLTVSEGATADLKGDNLYVGNASGVTGTVEVAGTGTKLSTGDSTNVYIGNSGIGTLTVSNGASASLGSMNVAAASGSSGTVSVSGANSSLSTASGTSYIGNSGTGKLTVSEGATATLKGDSLYVGNASGVTGTVEVTGTGTKLSTGNNTNIYIGNSGTGELTVSSAATAELNGYNTYVGKNSGSTGTVTVSEADSKLVSNGETYIGDSGTGTLSISNGGSTEITGGSLYIANASGSKGTVTVDGSTSSLAVADSAYVGDYGSGSLTISGGASADIDGDYLYVGSGLVSEGTVSVTGANSSLSAGNTTVGQAGTGTLSIDGGASAELNYLSIGSTDYSRGKVKVSGSDSSLTIDNNLYVGGAPEAASRTVTVSVVNIFARNYAPAELTIESGATTQVNGEYVYVGYNTDLEGVVTVDGEDTKLTTDDATSVYVGYNGTGTMTISNGGVASLGNLTIGANAGSKGTVKVSNSKLTVKDAVNLGSTDALGTSSLSVTDGSTMSVGGVINSYGGELKMDSSSALAASGLHVYAGQTSTLTLGGNNSLGTFTVDCTDGSSDLSLTLLASGESVLQGGIVVCDDLVTTGTATGNMDDWANVSVEIDLSYDGEDLVGNTVYLIKDGSSYVTFGDNIEIEGEKRSVSETPVTYTKEYNGNTYSLEYVYDGISLTFGDTIVIEPDIVPADEDPSLDTIEVVNKVLVRNVVGEVDTNDTQSEFTPNHGIADQPLTHVVAQGVDGDASDFVLATTTYLNEKGRIYKNADGEVLRSVVTVTDLGISDLTLYVSNRESTVSGGVLGIKDADDLTVNGSTEMVNDVTVENGGTLALVDETVVNADRKLNADNGTITLTNATMNIGGGNVDELRSNVYVRTNEMDWDALVDSSIDNSTIQLSEGSTLTFDKVQDDEALTALSINNSTIELADASSLSCTGDETTISESTIKLADASTVHFTNAQPLSSTLAEASVVGDISDLSETVSGKLTISNTSIELADASTLNSTGVETSISGTTIKLSGGSSINFLAPQSTDETVGETTEIAGETGSTEIGGSTGSTEIAGTTGDAGLGGSDDTTGATEIAGTTGNTELGGSTDESEDSQGSVDVGGFEDENAYITFGVRLADSSPVNVTVDNSTIDLSDTSSINGGEGVNMTVTNSSIKGVGKLSSFTSKNNTYTSGKNNVGVLELVNVASSNDTMGTSIIGDKVVSGALNNDTTNVMSQVKLSGGTTVSNGTFQLEVVGDSSKLGEGTSFQVLDLENPLDGGFTSFTETGTALIDGYSWDYTLLNSDGVVSIVFTDLSDGERMATTMLSSAKSVSFAGKVAMDHLANSFTGRFTEDDDSDVRDYSDRSNNFWVSALGTNDSVGTNGGRPGYTAQSMGYAVGYDRMFCPCFIEGIAVGQTWGEQTPKTLAGSRYTAGKVDQDAQLVSVYGFQKMLSCAEGQDEINLLHAVTYGKVSNKSSKTALFNNKTATAKWDDDVWSVGLRGVWNHQLSNGWTISPFVGVDYEHVSQGSFTERLGNNTARYSGGNYQNLDVSVGTSASCNFKFDNNMELTPMASIAYVGSVARNVPTVTVSTGNGKATREKAVDPGRNGISANVGVDWKINDALHVSAAYNVYAAQGATSQNANVTVNYAF